MAMILALAYVPFLVGTKGLSQNAADSFLEQLPSRAAANPASVERPLCIVFTPASPPEDPRLFGFGGYESWSFPGLWMFGTVAGLAVSLADDESDLVLRITGRALLGGNRPQFGYQLSVNGASLHAAR